MSIVPWTFETRPDTRTTNVRLGLWLFLASEAMFFGSLLSSYVLLRTGSASWPDGRELLDVRVGLISTALLLFISGSLIGTAKAGTVRLFASAAAALVFVVVTYFDFVQKLGAGLHPSVNLLLACWFALTGIHALHVVGGIGANLWLALAQTSSPAQLVERLRAVRLYWHFVTLIWFVFLAAFYF